MVWVYLQMLDNTECLRESGGMSLLMMSRTWPGRSKLMNTPYLARTCLRLRGSNLAPQPVVLGPHHDTQERDKSEGHLPPQCRLCRVGVPHSPAARPAMHRQSVTSDLTLFCNKQSTACVTEKVCGEQKIMGSKYPSQGKNASRHETLGSRNLMEQFTSVRAKVDMYFGKVSVLICESSGSLF